MKNTRNNSKIFSPQKKVMANIDRIIQLLDSGTCAPVLVEVDPSNACNHGCYFCISSYIHLPESKHLETFDRSIMSKDMLMSICEDFVELGVRAVNWTGGGEPTLNPNLKYAIEYLGKHKMKMGMFTNGTLLDKFDLFEYLVNYMTWVRFSIDSGTEKTFNHIRRPGKGQDWKKMLENLNKLIKLNEDKGGKIDIGVGFVITPDTYTEIVDFAKIFKDYNIKYCQYKPEVVNRERDGGIQRKKEFWGIIEPLLSEAKQILGDKYQINNYKLDDLEFDTIKYGRTYQKCLGSQISPTVGADGEVYVCTNHRGYKQYSYGNLSKKRFIEIWNDLQIRKKMMNKIDDVEKFCNCTQLCKPHESNKAIWGIYKEYNGLNDEEKAKYKESMIDLKKEMQESIIHPEFI